MTTYNTATQSIGAEKVYDNSPLPETSKQDKSAGTIELSSDGTSRLTLAQKSATVDVRAQEKSEIQASASGPSSEPIRLRSRMGAGVSAAQAEVNPSRYLLAIHGRETSLQAAIGAGWVIKGPDGNYYDARAGAPTPGKSEAEGVEESSEDTQDEAPEDDTSDAELPEGFELSEEQKETMAKLNALAEETPDAIDYALSHAAHDGDLSTEGFLQTLTEQTGKDRAEIEGLVNEAQSAYVSAADAAVAEVSNVEPQLVYDWLRESKPAMASRVIFDAGAGNFGAVKEATNEYINRLDTIDPDAALAADLGPHAKVERQNGKVAVRINGKLMSWREAMRYRES
jgi:hypothetical protein